MKQLGIPLGPGEDGGTGEVKRLAECDVSVTCSLRIGGGLNISRVVCRSRYWVGVHSSRDRHVLK
jgi:hypothetical protein